MKILLSIIFIFSLTACERPTPPSKDAPSSEYAMTCTSLGHRVVRCENKEAVCYGSNAGYGNSVILGKAGVDCQFKK